MTGKDIIDCKENTKSSLAVTVNEFLTQEVQSPHQANRTELPNVLMPHKQATDQTRSVGRKVISERSMIGDNQSVSETAKMKISSELNIVQRQVERLTLSKQHQHQKVIGSKGLHATLKKIGGFILFIHF